MIYDIQISTSALGLAISCCLNLVYILYIDAVGVR
jgi:hypothetical protein